MRLIAPLLLLLICSGTASAWPPDYNHRIEITENNGGASTLTDYQFNFTNDTNVLVAAGHMQADGADCRITDASDNLIPFWNETAFSASGTKIWANGTLTVGDNIFYMYYGNSGASDVSDGDTTFEFFGGFENTPKYFDDTGVAQPIRFNNMPPAAYYNNRTYIVWGGGDSTYDPYMAYYNHSTDAWSTAVKIGDPYAGTCIDDHGAPSMIIDANGYIHVFGAGGNPGCDLKHYKSNSVEDISAWTAQTNVVTTASDESVGYQKPVRDGNNIYLFNSRMPSPGCSVMIREVWYNKSSDNGATWADGVRIIEKTSTGTQYGVYQGHVELFGDKIHTTWCYVHYDGTYARIYNAYHAYLNTTDGHMYNMSGTDLGTSITKTEADASCMVEDTTSASYHSFIASLHVDASGNPYLIYPMQNSTDWRFRFTKWTGSAWSTPVTITTTDGYGDIYRCRNQADFIIHSTSNIESYVTTGGSSGSAKQGGDIERWDWDGSSWTKVSTVLTESESGQPLANPMIPLNFDTGLKVVFCEIKRGDYSTFLKLYAFNGVNFVMNSTDVAIDTAKWDMTTPTSTTIDANITIHRQGVASAKLHDGSSTDGPALISKSGFSMEKGVISAWMRTTASTGTGTQFMQMFLYEGTTAKGRIAFEASSGNFHYNDGAWHDTGVAYTDDTWYFFVAKFNCSSDTFDVIIYNATLTEIYRNNGVSFATGATVIDKVSFGSNSRCVGDGFVDSVRVRKYAATEPTSSLGAEEDAPSGGIETFVNPSFVSAGAAAILFVAAAGRFSINAWRNRRRKRRN